MAGEESLEQSCEQIYREPRRPRLPDRPDGKAAVADERSANAAAVNTDDARDVFEGRPSRTHEKLGVCGWYIVGHIKGGVKWKKGMVRISLSRV